MLRETFQGLLTPAKQLQKQYLPQIQQKAATLDAGQIMALVRGKSCRWCEAPEPLTTRRAFAPNAQAFTLNCYLLDSWQRLLPKPQALI